MNHIHFHNIRNMFRLYKALYELTDERFEEWNFLTEEEIVHQVMKKTYGILNPPVVRKVVMTLDSDELEGL